MVSRLAKLCARIVSSIAVFILLSGTTSAEEARRCYWCGPLAEQVHRSQRAPSCGIFDLEQHETVCDKGYTHCAIVASSPPYDESRICVKFYQDECYSLYCNTTKTWRMVCACQGDLCNGPKTERELTAFAVVPYRKTVKPRNKRALISNFISVKTKAPAENNTIIIINNKTIDNLHNDQPTETNNATMPKLIEDNLIIEYGTVPNDSLNHAFSKADDDTTSIQPPTMSATEDRLDNTKIEKPTTPILEFTTPAGFVKETHSYEVTQPSVSKISMNPTSIEVEVAVVRNILPDKQLTAETLQQNVTPTKAMETTEFAAVHNNVSPAKLPPAEALQQNIAPTKAIEPTTMGTVVMSTGINSIETTTLANDMRKPKGKNIGTQHFAQIIILVISFLIHFCL